MRPEDLVGAWILASFETTFSDGRPPVAPFGPDATGLLLYTADGHMSATLSRADRAPLAGTTLETTRRADDAAKAAAFDSTLTYAGRWHLSGDDVVHEVCHALSPGIVGQRNRRRATLRDGRLALSYTRGAPSGVTRTFTLVWRRP